MRVTEVMRDAREIFAGDAEGVGAVVIAGGDDHFAAVVFVVGAVLVFCVDYKGVVGARNAFDALIKGGFDAEVVDGAAVILESFGSGRLAAESGHGNVSDF